MKIYITTYDKRLSYAQQIKNMLKDCPYEYFFVYGKGNTQKLDPYIEVDVEEAYENLPEKTFCLVEHFLKTTKNDILMKMDDDVFIDLEKLKRYENIKEDYVGYFHAYELGEFGKYFHWYKIKNPEYKIFKRHFRLSYCEGALYFLSRKSCEKIIKDGREFYKNTPKTYLGEDVHVGMSLEDSAISKKDIKLITELQYEITEDYMSIHPISLSIFDKLKKSKTNEEKLEVLTKYNFLNENALRFTYLKNII